MPDAALIERRADIVEALRSIVPGEGVIVSEAERRAYESDGLTAYRQPPLVVVLPSTVEQVAAVLRYCKEIGDQSRAARRRHLAIRRRTAVGRRRASRHGQVQPHSRNRLRQPLRRRSARRHQSRRSPKRSSDAGFYYAPDPSSQIACTIGGNVAENSGGVHCLKYGLTTNNLLGIEMVLIDGEIIRLGGKHLDAEGYDLLGVMTGSEGLLGVVTEVTVRILPKPTTARALLVGFADNRGRRQLRRRGNRRRHHPGRHGDDGPAGDPCGRGFRQGRLSARCRGTADRRAGRPAGGSRLPGRQGRGDRPRPTRQHDPGQPRRGRAARVLVRAQGGLPGSRPDFARLLLHGRHDPARRAWPRCSRECGGFPSGIGLRVANVFHAGDGNLHPLILYDANKPGEVERAEAFGADILKLCVEVGGVLTGEHGVGVEKRDLMGTMFDEIDLAHQERLKCAFDPDGLLNPGKVFPQLHRCAELGRLHVHAGRLPFPDLPRF